MRRALALALLVALACGGDEPTDSAAADPREALAKDRRALADPAIHPLRDGMSIDGEALRQALLRLRSAHGPQVAVAYEASIEALPVADAPPAFAEVATHELPDDPAVRDAEAVNWLFDEDVRATVQRALSTHLTLMMVDRLGMSPSEIGVWMVFLRAAEPTLTRCGRSEGTEVLCLDYGSDVFVLDLRRRDPGWIVQRLRWLQATPPG